MLEHEVDYVECLVCESPCYIFEIDEKKGTILNAWCNVCGNDDPADFAIPPEEDEEE